MKALRGSKMTLLLPVALAGVAGSAFGDVVYQNDFESGVVGSEWSDTTHDALGGTFGGFLGRFEAGTVRLTLGGDTGNGGGGEPGTGSGGATKGDGVQPYNGSRGGGGAGGLGGAFGGNLPTRAFHDQPGSGGSGGGNGGGGNPGVEPGVYRLVFDLYLFDSWDGLDPRFGVDRFQVAANGTKLFDHAFETQDPTENALGGWQRPNENVYDTWPKELIYRDLTLSFTIASGGSPIEIDFISLQNQPLRDESWGIDNVRLSLVSGRSTAVPSTPAAVVLLGGLLGMSKRRRV